MPPPNMRSIFAKVVHQTSKSVVSRRNFSSPAAGDGKEPKKFDAMNSLVTQTIGIAAIAYASGVFIDRYLTLEGGGGGGGGS